MNRSIPFFITATAIITVLGGIFAGCADESKSAEARGNSVPCEHGMWQDGTPVKDAANHRECSHFRLTRIEDLQRMLGNVEAELAKLRSEAPRITQNDLNLRACMADEFGRQAKPTEDYHRIEDSSTKLALIKTMYMESLRWSYECEEVVTWYRDNLSTLDKEFPASSHHNPTVVIGRYFLHRLVRWQILAEIAKFNVAYAYRADYFRPVKNADYRTSNSPFFGRAQAVLLLSNEVRIAGEELHTVTGMKPRDVVENYRLGIREIFDEYTMETDRHRRWDLCKLVTSMIFERYMDDDGVDEYIYPDHGLAKEELDMLNCVDSEGPGDSGLRRTPEAELFDVDEDEPGALEEAKTPAEPETPAAEPSGQKPVPPPVTPKSEGKPTEPDVMPDGSMRVNMK